MLQRKAPQSPQAPKTPQDSAALQETIIGIGVRIKGNIHGNAKIEVHGTIEGNIKLDGLVVIAEGGKILGDVSASNVLVHGEVRGNVHAQDTVRLSANSKMKGNLQADKISIQEGALFQGRVDELPADGEARQPVSAPDEEFKKAAAGAAFQ